VDFVEICNAYIGKMITAPLTRFSKLARYKSCNNNNNNNNKTKAVKRIFNSDKIFRSYSDLNFGVTFLEHSFVYELLMGLSILETSVFEFHV